MNFELTEDQRKTANAACQENENRPILHCVHIRKGIIEAANGFIMVQKEIDYQGEEKILINIDELNNHKGLLHGKAVHYISTENGKIEARGKFTNIFKPMEGEYPDVEHLYPQKEHVFRIALGKVRLKEVLDSLDDNDETVRFTFYGETEPVKFETNSGKTRGCIMPMFVTW